MIDAGWGRYRTTPVVESTALPVLAPGAFSVGIVRLYSGFRVFLLATVRSVSVWLIDIQSRI